MFGALVPDVPAPGFSFELCKRNNLLEKKGIAIPKAIKTGTTIAGFIFKDGVILGADTRATEGPIVADKNCEKIHYIAQNIYCCGAGTAADTKMTTNMVASQMELHRLNTNRVIPVKTASTLLKQFLFKYQGHISAALVLGGVDNDGPSLYCIYPHGSVDNSKYTTMGSGSLAAMAVLEDRWKPDMSEEEGKELMCDAISAGVFNDLGSGSWVDITVIRKGSVDYIRPYKKANMKGQKQGFYRYKKGTTAVLKTDVIPIIVEDSTEHRIDLETMDTSS